MPGWEQLLTDGALRVAEAVKFSGLGRTALYEAMENNDLPYFKVGAARLIPRLALIQYLANEAAATGHGPPSQSAAQEGLT
jgi:excisionase family DNA binding protein